jgi:hypothetical protein
MLWTSLLIWAKEEPVYSLQYASSCGRYPRQYILHHHKRLYTKLCNYMTKSPIRSLNTRDAFHPTHTPRFCRAFVLGLSRPWRPYWVSHFPTQGSLCFIIFILYINVRNPNVLFSSQNYWVSGLFPSSGILENMTFRKLDLFPSTGDGGREDTYSVRPLRKS